MKRKFWTILLTLVAALCLCFAFTACDETKNGGTAGNNSQIEQPDPQKPDGGSQNDQGGTQGATHTHQFSSSWSSDDVTHWHAATCGHSVKQGESAHTYVNGICSTCNHAHENHVYGNWVDDVPASETSMGSRHKECVCGKRVTEQTPMISAFEFQLSGNGYAVTAYTGNLTEITVPAEHEGKPVTAIASRAFYDGAFTSLSLPTSLKEIGESAFGYCTKLQTVTIPNCTRVGNAAFIGCAALQEITLPQDVISLGDQLFQYCSALKKVTLLGGAVNASTFTGAESAEEIVLGQNVTSIAKGVFAGCKSLQKLTMPRVETDSNFLEYYFNLLPEVYTMSKTETIVSELPDDIVPDETTVYRVGSQVFALPKDGTTWSYCGRSVTVDGKTYEYSGKPIKVLKWKSCYDVSVRVSYSVPEQWTGEFYYYPTTPIQSLTVTDQLISVYDDVFDKCTCDIKIIKKYPITSISILGSEECYLDEFSQENYKLHVEYSDGFKEDFPLFDHISDSDRAALRTVGEHEITAKYQDKSCTKTVKIMLHTFDDAVLEGAEHIYDGSTYSLEVTGVPEGTTITYQNNGKSEAGEYTVTATLTKQYYETKMLTATLNILKQKYDIHYELGLENVTNDNPSDYVTNGENVKLKDPQLENSKRSSYEFLGWYTEADFQNKITEIKGNAHLDYTLYAKWQTVFTLLYGGTITGLTDYGKQQTELVIDETINGTKITSIGKKAFYQNTKLKKITIPDSVTSIGSSAFEDCSGLTGVYIADLLAWCKIDFGDYDANPLSYAHHLYVDNVELKILTIPNEITEIKPYVFRGCDGLTGELKIPDGVTSIGASAFSGCNGLTGELKIPDSVTSIGDSVFRGCSGLESVTIGSGVTLIDSYAFYGCSGLTSITIPDSVTSIGYYAFEDCSGLKSVTIGSGVTSIGNSAFYGCSGLTSITIPDNVTSIGGGAFEDCSGLESVIWNAGNCTYAGSSSYPIFKGCTSLKTVTFGETVKTIPAYAFYNCSGLTSVEIPDSVTSIGSYAFRGCSGLKSVTIGSGVTSIGSYAFSGCSGLTSIEIPDSVTSIGSYAFSGCSGLTSIEIPDSVTEIGRDAFYGCSGLTGALKIPDNVTSIGYWAFSGCSGLTSITIPDNVTSIGYGAFSGCSGLTSVTIGSGVTSIGGSAFYNCSGLENVYYKGTPSEWSGIKIDSDNYSLTRATRYYFSAQTPSAEQWRESTNWWHYAEDGTTIVLWTRES